MVKNHLETTSVNEKKKHREEVVFHIQKNWLDFSKWQTYEKEIQTSDYEKIADEVRENNGKLLKSFQDYLEIKEKLSQKVIKRHLENASLFIDDYLLYRGIKTVTADRLEVETFISDWFVGKFLKVNSASVEQLGASMTKLYKFLAEANEIADSDLKAIKLGIKEAVKQGKLNLENPEKYIHVIEG